jgi:hypothetical protein
MEPDLVYIQEPALEGQQTGGADEIARFVWERCYCKKKNGSIERTQEGK